MELVLRKEDVPQLEQLCLEFGGAVPWGRESDFSGGMLNGSCWYSWAPGDLLLQRLEI